MLKTEFKLTINGGFDTHEKVFESYPSEGDIISFIEEMFPNGVELYYRFGTSDNVLKNEFRGKSIEVLNKVSAKVDKIYNFEFGVVS